MIDVIEASVRVKVNLIEVFVLFHVSADWQPFGSCGPTTRSWRWGRTTSGCRTWRWCNPCKLILTEHISNIHISISIHYIYTIKCKPMVIVKIRSTIFITHIYLTNYSNEKKEYHRDKMILNFVENMSVTPLIVITFGLHNIDYNRRMVSFISNFSPLFGYKGSSNI